MDGGLCRCCYCLCCYEPDDDRRDQGTCSCCDAFHAKTIELLLIIGFAGSVLLISIAIIVGEWAQISYIIFSIFVVLLLLSGVGTLFSILIRIYRANDSILTTNYSKSLCLSKLIYLIIFISLLLAIIQDIFVSWAVDPDKKSKLNIKKDISHIHEGNNKDPKQSKQYSLAMTSITYNEFAQSILALFLYHLIQRIRDKETYGPSLRPHVEEQRNVEVNPIGFNPNQVDGSSERNSNLNSNNNSNISNNNSNLSKNKKLNENNEPSYQEGNYKSERVKKVKIIPHKKNHKNIHIKKNNKNQNKNKNVIGTTTKHFKHKKNNETKV